MGEKIKDLIRTHSSEIDVAVSSDNRTFENNLIEDNPHLNVPKIPQSYRRYGYGLLSYFSKKVTFDWFEDFGRTNSFKSVQSKMTNSGMSAIDLALTTLSTQLGIGKIVAPRNLYFASDELIKSYQKNIFQEITRFDSKSDLEARIAEIEEGTILYLEMCSNSPDMSSFDESLIRKYSGIFSYVVLDGSLIGLSRIDPSIFEYDNVIYVESLSKNYHLDDSSIVTSGIVVYSETLEEEFQKRFYCSGIYLQLNDLMEHPTDIYGVGKDRIEKIARNVQEFYRAAKKICGGSQIAISEISDDQRKIPLVLFIDFKEKSVLSAYITSSGIPQRGSFGHNQTCILPIGLMWDSAPPGLARLAFGKNRYSKKYLDALSEVIK